MSFRNILLISIVGLLVFSVSLSAAQDDLPPLRDLADMNDFNFGAAVYTTHLANPVHEETLIREFNMITPEQEAKMCEVEGSQGRYDFTRFDRLLEFAEANDMTFRAHTLLWHSCTPNWIENGDFTRDEAIAIMRNYIYTTVGRYKGRIPIWDVVNEAIDGNRYRNTVWYEMIGEEYVELAFQFAHEADPDALLFYNDYGAEGMNGKSNTIYNMVADFVERGIPIHGVGLQAHIGVGDTAPGRWLAVPNLQQNITRIGELGLVVHITELDVRWEGAEISDELLQQQAADYYRFITTCLESEYCDTVVTWGVTDALTWVRGVSSFNAPNAVPLLFDDEYQPKPAYHAVLDALALAAGMDGYYTDEERAELFDVEIPEPEEFEIPEPSFSDANQLAPDSVDGIVYYAPLAVNITLDGDISDWEGVPTVSMGDPDSDNESISFAVAADDENMYFLADVKDSHIISGVVDPSNWYQEDSVEFYLNATDDLFATSYTTGIAQIGLLAANVGNDGDPLIGGGNVQDSDVSYITVETETGYLIEASVPLVNDAWAIPAEHEAMIGFQVHVNGASAPDAPQATKLIWSAADTDDNSWQNPSVFGRLIFWDSENS